MIKSFLSLSGSDSSFHRADILRAGLLRVCLSGRRREERGGEQGNEFMRKRKGNRVYEICNRTSVKAL